MTSHPPSDSAPTPWDLLLAVSVAAGLAGGCTRADLVHACLLRDASALEPALAGAGREKLLQSRAGQFEPRTEPRVRHLARALQVALSYGIDYNAYRDPAVAGVLREGYGQPYFSPEDLDPALVRVLIEDGMLMAYSYRPPVYRLVQNPFLEALGAFHGLKLPPPAALEAPLVAAMRGERVAALRKRERPPELPVARRRGLTALQRLLRHDLVRTGSGILDPEGLRRLRLCREKVWNHVVEGVRLTVPIILGYHELLMGEVPEAGTLRTAEVTVANNPYFRTAPPDQIPDLLEEMVQRYRKRKPATVEDLVHDAAWLGNEVLYIHPFEDGNSRTARAVMAHFLGEHRSPLGDVPAPFDVMFLVGSKGSRSRNDEALAEVVWDMVIQTVNRAELALRAAG